MVQDERTLTLRCDGAARGNPGPAAAAFVLSNGTREIARGSRYLGVATNNVAEYQALIDGLDAARRHEPGRLEVRLDSELLVLQLRGTYRVRNAKLQPLWQRATELLKSFPGAEVQWVPRGANSEVDALANAALDARARRQAAEGPA